MFEGVSINYRPFSWNLNIDVLNSGSFEIFDGFQVKLDIKISPIPKFSVSTAHHLKITILMNEKEEFSYKKIYFSFDFLFSKRCTMCIIYKLL